MSLILPYDRTWAEEGNLIGSIYRLTKDCLEKLVHNDYRITSKLKEGDFVLCVKHSGDNFYDYIKLQVTKLQLRGIQSCQFGSYTLYENIDHIYFLALRKSERVRNGLWTPINKDLKIEYMIWKLKH